MNSTEAAVRMDPYRPPGEIADAAMMPSEISAMAQQGSSPGDLTKQILRRQFGVLLAVFFVVWCPLDLGIAYLEQFHIADDDIQTSFRLQQQSSLWFGVIATAAAIAVISATYDGRPQGFFAALGEGFRQWPKLWSTMFLYGAVCVLGLIAFVIPGVIFAVRGLYAMNIAAAEDVYGPTAITRSFAITKGRFWETFRRCLVVIGVYLLVILAYACIAIPLEFFAAGAFDDSYMNGFYNKLPWWFWLASGAMEWILLLADVFAAVYVYCWYRHVDRIESERPFESELGTAGDEDQPPKQTASNDPAPTRRDFTW